MNNKNTLSLPDLEALKIHLTVDPSSPSGLRWVKPVKPCRIKPGDIAGKKESDGSWSVRFKNKRYKNHRIIFYLTTEEDPGPSLIDHKDINPSNNKIENLRKSTSSLNQANTNKKAGFTSKYKGVSWSNQSKKWKCGICVNAKQIHIGYFDSEIDAANAYDLAAIKYFGNHCKLNFETNCNLI